MGGVLLSAPDSGKPEVYRSATRATLLPGATSRVGRQLVRSTPSALTRAVQASGPNACTRSACRSATASSPIEKRTKWPGNAERSSRIVRKS
jgi:hypothetical protein